MAKHHGKSGEVHAGGHVIAHVTKFSVKENVATADATEMGSAAEEHLVGISNWNASVDCWYDPADTQGQVALTIGAQVALELYTDGDATGKKFLTGTATVTDIAIDSDMAGTVKQSFNCKGTGALSRSTAS